MPCDGLTADSLKVGQRVFDSATQLGGTIVAFDRGLALVELDGIPQPVWCLAKTLRREPADGPTAPAP